MSRITKKRIVVGASALLLGSLGCTSGAETEARRASRESPSTLGPAEMFQVNAAAPAEGAATRPWTLTTVAVLDATGNRLGTQQLFTRGGDVIRRVITAQGELFLDVRCMGGQLQLFSYLNAPGREHGVLRDNLPASECVRQARAEFALPEEVVSGKSPGWQATLEGKPVLAYTVSLPEGHCTEATQMTLYVDPATRLPLRRGLHGSHDYPLRSYVYEQLEASVGAAAVPVEPRMPGMGLEAYRQQSPEQVARALGLATLPAELAGLKLSETLAFQFNKTMPSPTLYAMYRDTVSGRELQVSFARGIAPDLQAGPRTQLEASEGPLAYMAQEPEGHVKVMATDAQALAAGLAAFRPAALRADPELAARLGAAAPALP